MRDDDGFLNVDLEVGARLRTELDAIRRVRELGVECFAVDLEHAEPDVSARVFDLSLTSLRDLCIDVTHDNDSFDALCALSIRMPWCRILAQGRGEFHGGKFEGTWR
jgi:hypothetical protein